MRPVGFALLLAVAGFVVGAFTTAMAQGGPGSVWENLTAFESYPDLLEQGLLTSPIIGAVIGAAAGAMLGRPKRR